LNGKNKERIFDVMRAKEADFMVWMGDNVYYMSGQWKKRKKMWKKNIHARTRPRLQQLIENQPNYATWDDHDYGPNNSDASFKNKKEALEVFQTFWMNPSYGQAANDGVYHQFSQGGIDFFMLDTRYHNIPHEAMLGESQMKWLKESLLASEAPFKIIIAPTQLLSTNPAGEDWGDYPDEKADFMTFIEQENIEGLLIVSGDVHYGEYLTLEREGTYPLYEFSTSPMTSVINPTWTRKNPVREEGTIVLKQNFGFFSFYLDGDIPVCRMQLFGKDGQLFWERTVSSDDLKN